MTFTAIEINENTASNKPTDVVYASIKALLKANGYKYKRSLASAIEELEFTKDGKQTITICGWHGGGKKGTNRHFGDVKICLSLYIGNKTAWEFNGVYPHEFSYYMKCLEVMEQVVIQQVR